MHDTSHTVTDEAIQFRVSSLWSLSPSFLLLFRVCHDNGAPVPASPTAAPCNSAAVESLKLDSDMSVTMSVISTCARGELSPMTVKASVGLP